MMLYSVLTVAKTFIRLIVYNKAIFWKYSDIRGDIFFFSGGRSIFVLFMTRSVIVMILALKQKHMEILPDNMLTMPETCLQRIATS